MARTKAVAAAPVPHHPTVSQLLDELRKAAASDTERPPNTYTTKEIQAATKWGRPRVWAYLRRLVDEGRCEVVQIPRRRLDGVYSTMPAYRLTAT